MKRIVNESATRVILMIITDGLCDCADILEDQNANLDGRTRWLRTERGW